MSREQFCVYTANNVEEADIVAAWLASRDIEAAIPDRYAIGATTWGLPAMVPGGIEVCVADEQQAELAQSLLAEHAESIHSTLCGDAEELSPISVMCEGCHQIVTFAGDEAGNVAQCPNCSEYIDVPDASEI